jgi:hypothetical protein
MKTFTRIALCLLILPGMSAWTFAQEQINTTITITVPERGQAETIVKVSSPDKFAGSTKPQKPGDWYAMEV